VWGGDPALPADLPPTSPRADLDHRLLLAAARRGESPEGLFERALALVTSALAPVDPGRVASGRPSTARARRALVDAAREALAADPELSLADLAAALHVSASHLSRLFRAGTGDTVARHRMRLRARAALERLAAGDHDLTHLAADLGFADHSHLCRVIRAETDHTPSSLRHALR
jgi:AraC-like DNA-binding protein